MTKILLVEDDKSLREIYGVRLLAEGYDIVSAGDGEEALAMAIKERPALILSDVMMPKISGFDMLDILRSTTETRDIKVIMMTALSSEDQRLRGEKLGADRYLVKSQVGIEDVVRTVHDVLGDLPNMSPQQVQPNPYAQQSVATTNTSDTPRPDSYITQPPTSSTTPLPQPMAPFSSPMPRPAALGDRVIQPIQQNQIDPSDIGQMMEREISSVSIPPAPEAPISYDAQNDRPTIASLSPQQASDPTQSFGAHSPAGMPTQPNHSNPTPPDNQ